MSLLYAEALERAAKYAEQYAVTIQDQLGGGDVMFQWEEEKREQFEDRWPVVKSLMYAFRQYGIFLSDVKPGNVVFGDEDG